MAGCRRIDRLGWADKKPLEHPWIEVEPKDVCLFFLIWVFANGGWKLVG